MERIQPNAETAVHYAVEAEEEADRARLAIQNPERDGQRDQEQKFDQPQIVARAFWKIHGNPTGGM